MSERTSPFSGSPETPIEMTELKLALDTRNLGGMPPVVKLLIAEERIRTYESLLTALDDPEHWNPYGYFEIQSTNISRSVAIMGTAYGNPHPTRHIAVISGDIISDMKEVIEDVLKEAAEEQSAE